MLSAVAASAACRIPAVVTPLGSSTRAFSASLTSLPPIQTATSVPAGT
jgi:hypothetical protein